MIFMNSTYHYESRTESYLKDFLKNNECYV